MFRTLSLVGGLVALSIAGSGCVVSGQVRTRAYVETPSMVLVEPGVYVVADYDEPVFYNSGYYWLYRDGYWLRSYDYSGGWVRVRTVPYGVRRINRPYSYRHYRPARARYYRTPVRDHRSRSYRQPVRDHRSRSYRGDRVERHDNRSRVRDHRSQRARQPPPTSDHRRDRRRDRRDDDDDNTRDHRRQRR